MCSAGRLRLLFTEEFVRLGNLWWEKQWFCLDCLPRVLYTSYFLGCGCFTSLLPMGELLWTFYLCFCTKCGCWVLSLPWLICVKDVASPYYALRNVSSLLHLLTRVTGWLFFQFKSRNCFFATKASSEAVGAIFYIFAAQRVGGGAMSPPLEFRELQTCWLHPEWLDYSLHFNKLPRWPIRTGVWANCKSFLLSDSLPVVAASRKWIFHCHFL